jgi:hypothetical protein
MRAIWGIAAPGGLALPAGKAMTGTCSKAFLLYSGYQKNISPEHRK